MAGMPTKGKAAPLFIKSSTMAQPIPRLDPVTKHIETSVLYCHSICLLTEEIYDTMF
jgi:hypothetical protein